MQHTRGEGKLRCFGAEVVALFVHTPNGLCQASRRTPENRQLRREEPEPERRRRTRETRSVWRLGLQFPANCSTCCRSMALRQLQHVVIFTGHAAASVLRLNVFPTISPLAVVAEVWESSA